MRLFIVEEDGVELNKEWMFLIPEFATLIRRDKGSKGDYRGEKKLKARKEFTFIYFDLDFTSPIRDWEDFERREEAMKYAELTEADLDEEVMAAHSKYNELLLKAARSLRTLRSVKKSLDALDKYYEDIDFSEVDKKGELKHDMSSYLNNIPKLAKAYDAVEQFEKRVMDELKGEESIRGKNTLGGKEGKRTDNNWNEGAAQPAERIPSTNMKDLAQILAMEKDEEDED